MTPLAAAVAELRGVAADAVPVILTIPAPVAMKNVPALVPPSAAAAYHTLPLEIDDVKDASPRHDTRATVQLEPGMSPAAESYAAKTTCLPSVVAASLPSAVLVPGNVARPPAAADGICHDCTIVLAVMLVPSAMGTAVGGTE